MMKVRSEAISAMLRKFNRHIDMHIYKAQTCKLRGEAAAQECQAFVLGQLIRASAGLSKHPQPSVSDFHCGVADVHAILMAINLKSYYEKRSHKSCNVGKKMLKEIQRVYDDIPSPVLDSHRIHLQEQWKKGNPDLDFT
jgi:hypothetical protein